MNTGSKHLCVLVFKINHQRNGKEQRKNVDHVARHY